MAKSEIISIKNEYGFTLTVGMKVVPNPNAFAPIRNEDVLTIQEFSNSFGGWMVKDGDEYQSIHKMMPLTNNPSDFTEFPSGSVMQNFELERIAVNIMVILKRTGNTFRELSYEEYEVERMKDGGYHKSLEFDRFIKVIGYCKNADTARLFSPAWEKVAEV